MGPIPSFFTATLLGSATLAAKSSRRRIDEWQTWTGMGITYHGPAYDVATYCPATSTSGPIGNMCWRLDNDASFKPDVLAPYCDSESTTHPIAFGHPASLECGECAEIRVLRQDGTYNKIVVMTTDNPGSVNTSPELTTAGKDLLTEGTGKQRGDRLPFDWRKVDCTVTELAAPNAELTDSELVGYYSWTWGSGSTGPSGANAGVAFGGAIDVQTAINAYINPDWSQPDGGAGKCWVTGGCPPLNGVKFLNIGGDGSGTGSIWTADNIAQVIADASKIPAAGYVGVSLDVEVAQGSTSELVQGFTDLLQTLKGLGLKTALTVSHSAPFDVSPSQSTATALVKAFCASDNLDYVSPQLYDCSDATTCEQTLVETTNCKSLGGSDSCTWDIYQDCKAKFVPSVMDAAHYPAAQSYFQTTYGIQSEGFFQWLQERN